MRENAIDFTLQIFVYTLPTEVSQRKASTYVLSVQKENIHVYLMFREQFI